MIKKKEGRKKEEGKKEGSEADDSLNMVRVYRRVREGKEEGGEC